MRADRLKFVTAALASVLLASACGGATAAVVQTSVVRETQIVKETQIVEQTVEVAITPTPAPGNQVLRWALEGINEPSTLDPAKAGDAQIVFATGLIFRGLVQ